MLKLTPQRAVSDAIFGCRHLIQIDVQKLIQCVTAREGLILGRL
jgi:hypothetical protein